MPSWHSYFLMIRLNIECRRSNSGFLAFCKPDLDTFGGDGEGKLCKDGGRKAMATELAGMACSAL